MVDHVGFEPMTSSMPWRRSPSCANSPRLVHAHLKACLIRIIIALSFVNEFPQFRVITALIGNQHKRLVRPRQFERRSFPWENRPPFAVCVRPCIGKAFSIRFLRSKSFQFTAVQRAVNENRIVELSAFIGTIAVKRLDSRI